MRELLHYLAAQTDSSGNAGWFVLGGVIVTQGTLIALAMINRKDIRAAKKVAESTNESVNHVDPGEPSLINKMRTAQTDIRFLKESHLWQRDILVRLAGSVGIHAGPPPVDPADKEKEKEETYG